MYLLLTTGKIIFLQGKINTTLVNKGFYENEKEYEYGRGAIWIG